MTFSSYKAATNRAAKGYILNNQIKPIEYKPIVLETNDKFETKKQEEAFDTKRALKPLALLTGAAIGAIGLISVATRAYSKSLAKLDNVRPPDLARNINIVEEPHFAMYRALRDPNAKNILGLIGVGLMSGVTLCAKHFVDGVKKIWVKKEKCDNDYWYQKKSIDYETQAFSGKLDVINSMLEEASNTLNFKGNIKKEEDQKEKDFNKKDNNKAPVLIAALGALGFSAFAFGLFKNYQKTVKNFDTFVAKTTDSEIREKINQAVNEPDKNKAIKLLSDILKTINAGEDKIKENLSKINGITPEEVEKTTKNIKENQIYVQAPEALGGVSEKIQYYCYINEDRGHLYNWILNPENKFNKYIFLAFSAISSIGYLAKEAASGIEEVTVQKEGTKSELELKRRLVEVEIENFKAKKRSAINPLIENYKLQKQKGASKQELDELAQNILLEIKNGPPYVYD